MDKITHYVNSKIITRVKEEEEAGDGNTDMNMVKEKPGSDSNTVIIEFRHKSLFEYFCARAMKFDFDIHQENIYKLPLAELEKFSINQKSIMNVGYNQSE